MYVCLAHTYIVCTFLSHSSDLVHDKRSTSALRSRLVHALQKMTLNSHLQKNQKKKNQIKSTQIYLENERLPSNSVNWKRTRRPQKLIPNQKIVGEKEITTL
jgi:hypothetical protein